MPVCAVTPDTDPSTPSTLVLGIGNTLLSDEGVGVHAMHRLTEQCRDLGAVEFLDGGTLSFTLANPIADNPNLIVIDAANFNAEPGTVRVFLDGAMDEFLNAAGKRSVHEVGLIDLLSIASLTGTLPERRALIGVQPLELGWGEQPSAAVAAAIPRVCEIARQLLLDWQA